MTSVGQTFGCGI